MNNITLTVSGDLAAIVNHISQKLGASPVQLATALIGVALEGYDSQIIEPDFADIMDRILAEGPSIPRWKQQVEAP